MHVFMYFLYLGPPPLHHNGKESIKVFQHGSTINSSLLLSFLTQKKKSKAPHSRVHSDLSPAPSRTDSRSGGGGAGGGGGGRKTKTGGKSRLFRTGSVSGFN